MHIIANSPNPPSPTHIWRLEYDDDGTPRLLIDDEVVLCISSDEKYVYLGSPAQFESLGLHL